jgi:hypothetical protein
MNSCVCHSGSICSDACSRGICHDGCLGGNVRCGTWVTNSKPPDDGYLRIKQCVLDENHEGECEMGLWRNV